nr:immunoglobulin light chain junction region [Macaca mulatta]
DYYCEAPDDSLSSPVF